MDNISAWNAKIDKTLTVMRWGRQGILYEYILPYGANPMKYYEEAIDVKSRKMGKRRPSTKNKKFYRPGTYQPVGDKRYFNFYQLNKMKEKDWVQWQKDIERRKRERIASIIAKSVAKVMSGER